MEKINFSLMQIIVEGQNQGERFVFPTIDCFKGIERNITFSFEDNYYEINTIVKDEYLWMSFEFGNPNPRDEKLTNVTNSVKRDNDRTKDEVELLNQLFVLYDGKHTVYISDSRRKKVVTSLLKERLSIDIMLKSFYKTEQEIIDILKQVDKIQFSNVNDLFNQDSVERKALTDLTGVDTPDKFTIETEYARSRPVTSFLNRLFDAKSKHKISSLVISGRNEENISFIYNGDTFSRKIEVKCAKDENGKYNPDNVLAELLKQRIDER